MNCLWMIIDMQEDFFRGNEALIKKRPLLITKTNELISFCRTQEIPIVWVRAEFEEDLRDAFIIMREKNIRKNIRGTDGCQILKELNKKDTDLEVIKKRYSAFYKTHLENKLIELGIDTVILAGVNTHACIRMSAVDAYQRDYKVFLARECIDSYDENFHQETLRYLSQHIAKILSNEDIYSILVRKNK